MKNTQPLVAKIDITNCEKEQIHLLGHVQPFGCLFAFSTDWILTHVSENVEKFIHNKAKNLLGKEAKTFFSKECLHNLQGALQTSLVTKSSGRVFQVSVNENDDAKFDISVHKNEERIIVEIERSAKRLLNEVTLTAQNMIGRLNSETNLHQLLDKAAKQVRMVTGYDRVMVYKFLPDESGEVIAESKSLGIDSFLGLRYPASDIPKQARALYKKQLLRVISSINDKREVILAKDNADSPLDLSFSVCRAVSPIHLEYLRNMGIDSSLSVSIMVNGKLWGLFACHHESAKYVPFDIRTLLEFFTEIFALKLAAIERDELYQYEKNSRLIHDQVMAQMNMENSSFVDIKQHLPLLKSIIKCDAISIWFDEKYALEGEGLNKNEAEILVEYFNSQPSKDVHYIENITSVLPDAKNYTDKVAGVLAISVSRQPRDYLLYFRKALSHSVNWGGNPEKPIELCENGARLTPRKSFEIWKVENINTCEPWSDSDLHITKSLRITLLEVLLKHMYDKEQYRSEAQEKQDTLISELNHRVRNILSLMSSIVSLTDDKATNKKQFKMLLDGRIRALSFAHDQLTMANWSAVGLLKLLSNEANAYTEDSSKVILEGFDIKLKPNAVSCVALVMHEMFTNAAKYGALNSNEGTLHIKWSISQQGDLLLTWQELGGPDVYSPTRIGFGSTIINRSIPHELNGASELFYETSGLRALFTIPSEYIEVQNDSSAILNELSESSNEKKQLRFTSILLVEDNFIIALDAENIVSDIGFKEVFVESNVAEALECIESANPSCAILDFNLGAESSLPIAETLLKKKIPFLFVSGYGNDLDLPEYLTGVEIVSKPYDQNQLIHALLKL